MGGHVWLSYDSINGKKLTIDSENISFSDTTFTMGTWSKTVTKTYDGLFINKEFDFDWKGAYYFKKRITSSQANKMIGTVEISDTWKYNYTCAAFATDVFKSATGISFRGVVPPTPQLVISNMTESYMS